MPANTWLESKAVFSRCRRFRYSLTRVWDADAARVLWIMLNPSTADADSNDATITRCETYARDWGYGGIRVVNLFALCATFPADLIKAGFLVGPHNDVHIRRALRHLNNSDIVLCAWGRHAVGSARVARVLNLIAASGAEPLCLKYNKDGTPAHPGRLKRTLTPIPYTVAAD